MITFASISPHPPIILPSVGSKEDHLQVKKTLAALASLAEKFKKAKPDSIIISSPHPDWGFNVPLYFLAQDFKGDYNPPTASSHSQSERAPIKTYLMGMEESKHYLAQGKKVYQELDKTKKYALIASGDLSHCLKEEGPYGFNPDGPKFDQDLIEALKKKDIKKILELDNLYPEAGECGLRSFCFLLGVLEASETNWQTEILSYEGPFGVGYLVANFNLL